MHPPTHGIGRRGDDIRQPTHDVRETWRWMRARGSMDSLRVLKKKEKLPLFSLYIARFIQVSPNSVFQPSQIGQQGQIHCQQSRENAMADLAFTEKGDVLVHLNETSNITIFLVILAHLNITPNTLYEWYRLRPPLTRFFSRGRSLRRARMWLA